MEGCAPEDLRAKPFEAHQTCHSAKRTHLFWAEFVVDRFYLQGLTRFAAAFANGFVLKKRTHLSLKQFGAGGLEVGIDNHGRSVTIGGAGDGTTDEVRHG